MIANEIDSFLFFGNLQIEDDEMEFNGLFIGECDLNRCRREMMPRDDGWKGHRIRLQAKTNPDADYMPLLINSINPMA
jgi:hypothetical protein